MESVRSIAQYGCRAKKRAQWGSCCRPASESTPPLASQRCYRAGSENTLLKDLKRRRPLLRPTQRTGEAAWRRRQTQPADYIVARLRARTLLWDGNIWRRSTDKASRLGVAGTANQGLPAAKAKLRAGRGTVHRYLRTRCLSLARRLMCCRDTFSRTDGMRNCRSFLFLFF